MYNLTAVIPVRAGSQRVKDKNIKLFASVWDEPSVDFMSKNTDIMKISSA